MWLGLGLCFMCLLLASFISEVWQLIMLQGVIFGVGGGLLYFPTMLLLPQWFVRRRGLAAGIIFSGSGLGGFVFPLVLNALLERVGFRWTLRIWATTMLLVCAVALLGMQPRVPIPMFQEGQGRPRFIPPQMQFVKTPLFWSFVSCDIMCPSRFRNVHSVQGAATVLQAMSYFPVSLYIATFARIVSSPLSATIALSIFNSTTVVGQILIGHLCDRFPYAWVMFASALGSGIAAFLLWGFAHTLPLVFFFAIVFGSLSGGFSSVAPVAAADCAGSKPEQLGIICACSFLLKGIAVVVGPVLSGILYNIGKSSSHNTPARYGFFGFGPIEIFVGTCAIATSITSILVAAARQRPRAQ
ncbi:hypothetical protein AcV5_009127 [Taiwanofungus camphoratus]|nr:hypothetical protein AcV5_009127 [Antrodia cinnamomea]